MSSNKWMSLFPGPITSGPKIFTAFSTTPLADTCSINHRNTIASPVSAPIPFPWICPDIIFIYVMMRAGITGQFPGSRSGKTLIRQNIPLVTAFPIRSMNASMTGYRLPRRCSSREVKMFFSGISDLRTRRTGSVT